MKRKEITRCFARVCCMCVVHISSPCLVWPFKLVESSLLSKINWRIDWAALQTHYIDVGGARASVYITYRMNKGRIMTSRFWFKHDKVQSTWKSRNHSLFTIIYQQQKIKAINIYVYNKCICCDNYFFILSVKNRKHFCKINDSNYYS